MSMFAPRVFRKVPDPSPSYRQRLAAAAGLGFVSAPRRPAGRRIIDGMLARGFRRPELAYPGDGTVRIRAYYGLHRITRTFALTSDGKLPDQIVLAGLRLTADRMDAKRPGGCGKRRRAAAASAPGHWFYVYHGNEQPKLDELVSVLPPEGGMAAYLAEMSATEASFPDTLSRAA